MASLSDLASHHFHDHDSHRNHSLHNYHHSRSASHRSSSASKIAKGARGSHKVKPMLKRLASTSSPKNSLDLDRGWEDQVVDLGYNTPTSYDASRPSMSPSLRDVNFHFPPAWEPTGYSSAGEAASGPLGATSTSIPGRASGTATPVGSGPSSGAEPPAVLTSSSSLLHNGATASARNISRGRYQHTRSASAASHVSIGTSGSSHRPGGSFVHPFQQTPRTSTPPLTYANSFTSFERENNPARDYSPTIITENEDDDDLDNPPHTSNPTSQSFAASSHLNRPQPSNSHSTTSLRRPSLASQRTSSLSDMRNHLVNNHHSHTTSSSGNSSHAAPLRVNTTPAFPRSVPTSARLALASLTTPNSASDLHLSMSPTDSPRPSIHLASPATASTSTMTPFRTSLEGTFRLRSRSDIETGARHEDIREARRKFEETERLKQEKYEAEQRRKQERRAEKERAAAARRNTGGSEVSIGGRPSFSRRRSPPTASAVGSSISGSRRARSHRSTTSHHGGAATATTMTVMNEKTEGVSTGFLSSNYESMAGGDMPNYEQDLNDVHFDTPMRANTTKRKTQSYWTAFVLWFRTRLLKLGRH
ncbi:hypothetical protein BD289DRAFT_452761 [Coniella lustricola]|uniref:Uncharacterized protein n=1 Tax=Coniella lustricola TaxID=2025994 RepID=A0A2T3AA41_9PEZI|nr:hypothetical protein BD289DRAFT_452761 [Coniella lustricola]